MDAAVYNVLAAMLKPLQTGGLTGLGDVTEGALADVHELAVAPMRAGREVRPIVVARVEEHALRAGRQVRRREAAADDAHEQVPAVDKVPAVVRPTVAAPAAREQVDRDSVEGRKAAGPHDELDEGERQHAAVGNAVSRRRGQWVPRIGAVEQRVHHVGGLQLLEALLRTTVIAAAGEAQEVMREGSGLRSKEVAAVFAVLRVVQFHPGSRAKPAEEVLANEGETSSLGGIQELRYQPPEIRRQHGHLGLAGWPTINLGPIVGRVAHVLHANVMQHGRVIAVFAQLGVKLGIGGLVFESVGLQRRNGGHRRDILAGGARLQVGTEVRGGGAVALAEDLAGFLGTQGIGKEGSNAAPIARTVGGHDGGGLGGTKDGGGGGGERKGSRAASGLKPQKQVGDDEAAADVMQQVT